MKVLQTSAGGSLTQRKPAVEYHARLTGMIVMLEPDANQNRPEMTVAAVRDLWNGLRIEPCAVVAPPVDRLLDALRKTHVNGGAAFGMFSIADDPVLHWYMSRNRWNEIGFPDLFLRSLTVTRTLGDVCREPVADTFAFEWGSPFTIAGELAETLTRGGAYEAHEGGAADAFAIADDFCKSVFGDRFDEVIVQKSVKPWSAWFYDVAWDGTWVLMDKRLGRVSVLALTDTD